MFDFTVKQNRNTVATLISDDIVYKVRFYCGEYNAMDFEKISDDKIVEYNKIVQEWNAEGAKLDLLLP